MFDPIDVVKGTLQDHNGTNLLPDTTADQVIFPDGQTLEQKLVSATLKEYTATSSSNTALVVDVSDFVLDDAGSYSYTLELLSATSDAETNLGVVPVLHIATQAVVISRVAVTSSKVVEVKFRIIKRKL